MGSSEGGHYTADVLMEKDWITFDDTRVGTTFPGPFGKHIKKLSIDGFGPETIIANEDAYRFKPGKPANDELINAWGQVVQEHSPPRAGESLTDILLEAHWIDRRAAETD
jgi:hypothetical protein